MTYAEFCERVGAERNEADIMLFVAIESLALCPTTYVNCSRETIYYDLRRYADRAIGVDPKHNWYRPTPSA